MLDQITPQQLAEWHAVLDYMPDRVDDQWKQAGVVAATTANSIRSALKSFSKGNNREEPIQPPAFIPKVERKTATQTDPRLMAKQFMAMAGF